MQIKSQTTSYKSALLSFVLAAAFFALPFSASAQANDLDVTALVKELNEDRVAAGLHPLRRNAMLDAAAELKAADMVEHNYFAHTSPQGINPWHWFAEAGYEYVFAGENLALDFNKAEAAQKAWMESPKHRDNVLNSGYEEVGYAISYGTFYTVNGQRKTRQGPIIVQLFGKATPRLAALQSFNNEPLANPAEAAETNLNFNTLEGLTKSIDRLSGRMLSSVINYSVAEAKTEAVEQQPVVIKAKTFNTTPPIETWPAVSLGLALVMMSAGIHTKFL